MVVEIPISGSLGLGSELERADRFAAYVSELTKVLAHADRERPFRDYCAGLLATVPSEQDASSANPVLRLPSMQRSAVAFLLRSKATTRSCRPRGRLQIQPVSFR
jgi:SRSO17 transposase